MIRLDQYIAGHYEKLSGYQYFVPEKINSEWEWGNPALNNLLEKAAVRLGELNSFSKLVPNMNLFIHMHVTKEAVLSSRIEGTRTNIDEAIMPVNEVSAERRDDWMEVQNYTLALTKAVTALRVLPISTRLLKQAHAVLLDNARGNQKQPDEYRRSQNWIGGKSLSDAVFIPPHHQHIDELMSDLENFLHNPDIATPALVRIAIAHYQFETIHPFLDGNGRIGRLMIPLYLVSEGLLQLPLLYLSHYFESNKALYYDNLMRVRTHNDMTQWLKYFLVGIEQTCSRGVRTLMAILELKSDAGSRIQQTLGRRAPSALTLLNFLFTQPVVSINDVARECKISFRAASMLVNELEGIHLLSEITGHGRNRLYSFEQYLKIFREL